MIGKAVLPELPATGDEAGTNRLQYLAQAKAVLISVPQGPVGGSDSCHPFRLGKVPI